MARKMAKRSLRQSPLTSSKGDGTFRVAHRYKSPGGALPTSAAVADVDGDGKPDLTVTDASSAGNGNNHGEVNWFAGNGDGTFQPPVTFDAGGFFTHWAAVADVNGDDKPDVIVANWCAEPIVCAQASVGLLLNNASADTTPPTITVSASPKILFPPNGTMVPVAVSGTIVDSGSGVKASSAEYIVRDEYHLIQPQGKITLNSTGAYSFTISLQASRQEQDRDGRQYAIRVSAKDNVGHRSLKWVSVRVPHGD